MNLIWETLQHDRRIKIYKEHDKIRWENNASETLLFKNPTPEKRELIRYIIKLYGNKTFGQKYTSSLG